EIDYPNVFADSARYLGAAVEATGDQKLTVDDLARKHSLNAAFLKRWVEVLALEPSDRKTADAPDLGKPIPLVPLELLDEKMPKNEQKPAINGWRKKGTDLPALFTNSSDRTEHIPGRASPHKVTVHPMPREFVAAVWKSPVEGPVRITGKVAHAHPACGNGVAWWLEHRRSERAVVLGEGVIDVGGEVQIPGRNLKIARGDQLVLIVDARDGNHSCDLTEITLTISETDKPNRTWDLAGDVADNVLDGNPHADRLGNKEVWS